MTDTGIKLSAADKLRLAQVRQKAILTHARAFGKTRENNNHQLAKNIPGFSTYSGQKKKLFIPQAKTPVVTTQPAVAAKVGEESSRFLHGEKIEQTVSEADSKEITLTKEECFCAVMDILLADMSKADKASKEAAKYLMMVMENEAGHSVSLLVYNAYVRRYNSLRQQYFLSAAANIKAKTIKISSDIIASLEQMAKTVNIEMLPHINIPRRMS